MAEKNLTVRKTIETLITRYGVPIINFPITTATPMRPLSNDSKDKLHDKSAKQQR